jgi:glycosyltransferase involved in cell wall biosynthesis
LRILWVALKHPLCNRAGGAEKTILEIGSRLEQMGHDFHLLCGASEERAGSKDLLPFRVHAFRGLLLPHLTSPAVILSEGPFDVIVDDLAHVVPWLTPFVSRSKGVAFFRHLHARTLRGQVPRPVSDVLKLIESTYPKVYPKWPFVCESVGSASDLAGIGVALGRIIRIPPGVDTDWFRPGVPSPSPELLYFGGLRPYKRPEHSIQVLAGVLREGFNCRLVIVGDGGCVGELKRQSIAMGLEDKISFTGRVDEATLLRIIQHAWINVHCSVSEGWCYSASEAAACGVPTVGYAVPGLSESVVERKTGTLVQSGNIPLLTAATIAMIRSIDTYRLNCLHLSRSRTWDDAAIDWEQMLRMVRDE